MRKYLFILFFSLLFKCYSQKDSLKITGSIILTNNGIDPVPAFALGKPALMSTISISKGKFVYINMFNYSVTDLKPWSQTNWFLWKIPTSNKAFFRFGPALSFFDKREKLDFNGKKNVEAQILNQYLGFETSYTHRFSPNFSINFTNWYERGVEWDAVSWGDFAVFSTNFSNIALGKKLKLNFSPNVFYLKNASPSEGFFVSETATLYFGKSHLGLYNQIVQPLITKPRSDMNWNVGVVYRL